MRKKLSRKKQEKLWKKKLERLRTQMIEDFKRVEKERKKK